MGEPVNEGIEEPRPRTVVGHGVGQDRPHLSLHGPTMDPQLFLDGIVEIPDIHRRHRTHLPDPAC
jgi:hypothetical protein